MTIQNKINVSTSDVSPFVLQQEETARCAIDEKGMILYANEAFCELANLGETHGTDALDVFTFTKDTLSEGQSIKDVHTGEHEVLIGGSPILQDFYFEWLQTPDNRNILIASTASNSLENELAGDFDALLDKIQNSTLRIKTTQHPQEKRIFPHRTMPFSCLCHMI